MTQHAHSLDPIDPFDESKMTLMEHLMELRYRLMWIVGAVAFGTMVAMSFSNWLIRLIAYPLSGYQAQLQALGPTDTIFIFIKVSFTAGTAIAIPIIAYHLIAYVAPGLYPHEKRALLMLLPAIMLLFLAGAAFAFFVMLPVAVGFLQTFLSGPQDVIKADWAVDRYISLVTRIVFWIAVSFETPLVFSFLARIGLVSGPALLRFWRHAIVVIAILAAAITPTIDPVNMAIVMGPLFVLYMMSVGLAYLLYRPRDPRNFSDDLE